ncbi:uncharacterized protein METZ01_LOCUS482635, partial [marine metagenome]
MSLNSIFLLLIFKILQILYAIEFTLELNETKLQINEGKELLDIIFLYTLRISLTDINGLNCIPSPSMNIFFFLIKFKTNIFITKSSLIVFEKPKSVA